MDWLKSDVRDSTTYHYDRIDVEMDWDEEDNFKEFDFSTKEMEKVHEKQKELFEQFVNGQVLFYLKRYREKCVEYKHEKIRQNKTFLDHVKTIIDILEKDYKDLKKETVYQNIKVKLSFDALLIEESEYIFPPLNWRYTEEQLPQVRRSYHSFLNNNYWDYTKVKCPQCLNVDDIENIVVDELKNEIKASVLYNLLTEIRNHSTVINSFKLDFESFDLGDIIIKNRFNDNFLPIYIENGFINEEDQNLFSNTVTGMYVFPFEKIKWNRSTDSLRYFVQQISQHVKNEEDKYAIACNVFLNKDGGEMKPTSLRTVKYRGSNKSDRDIIQQSFDKLING